MERIREIWAFTLLFAAGALTAAGHAAAAEAAGAEDAYTWHAELVSYDEAAGTMTVKARVESHAEIEGLDDFEEGQSLTLTWTGRSWASGIRDLSTEEGAADGRLTLPVEFVSFEMDGRYVTFRVPVPEQAAATLSALEPGRFVIATTPRSPGAEAVTDVRPYGADA